MTIFPREEPVSNFRSQSGIALHRDSLFPKPMRIVERVHGARRAAPAADLIRRRVGESNIRADDGHGVRVACVDGLAIDELECSRRSIACCVPDEYPGRVVGSGQPRYRPGSIDLEILPVWAIEVSAPDRSEKLEIEYII
jgi:hypothetical protein